MRLAPTEFDGLFVVETAPSRDERGYFHRLFDDETFRAAGIGFMPRQSGISYNAKRGTLRGMHYQKAPASQPKLVRCIRGAIYDVAVDIRPASPSYRRWFAAELSAENGRGLYIPDGFAHGFLSLTDNAEVLYDLGAGEMRDSAAGLRWNDPAFGIRWPFDPLVINSRDAGWPDYAGV